MNHGESSDVSKKYILQPQINFVQFMLYIFETTPPSVANWLAPLSLCHSVHWTSCLQDVALVKRGRTNGPSLWTKRWAGLKKVLHPSQAEAQHEILCSCRLVSLSLKSPVSWWPCSSGRSFYLSIFTFPIRHSQEGDCPDRQDQARRSPPKMLFHFVSLLLPNAVSKGRTHMNVNSGSIVTSVLQSDFIAGPSSLGPHSQR